MRLSSTNQPSSTRSLWNDVFNFAESYIKLTPGTIRATVVRLIRLSPSLFMTYTADLSISSLQLIETLPAAFQMDEIIYELREHSSGLNCGRWDYVRLSSPPPQSVG